MTETDHKNNKTHLDPAKPDAGSSALSPRSDMARRYAVLIMGIVIMSFGIAFCIKGDLGTTPISSLPYVTSLMSGLTVGTTTIILHITLILLQILLLRRKYNPIQLLQLPVALAFGWTIDLALFIIRGVNPESYPARWAVCLLGTVLVSIGVACEVIADVVTLAGEGFVIAVTKAFHLPFPPVKIGFDVFLVALSVVLSITFLGGVHGVREGTVAAAFLVGLMSKPLIRRFSLGAS